MPLFNVQIPEDLKKEIQKIAVEDDTYGNVSQFVIEASRLHLLRLKRIKKEGI